MRDQEHIFNPSMTRFTDPEFHLPVVHALLPGMELNSGANRPVVITCVDKDSGQREDYVVKLLASERMTPEAQMRETLASFIAMEMDMATPAPAVVCIGPELVHAMDGQQIYGRLAKSVGENFGSTLLNEAPEVLFGADLNAEQLKDAQFVLSFDALLRHFDRRMEKPNLLSDGTRLYVIDHELAFGFVFDLFPSATPWVLSEHEIKMLPNHLLYNKVRRTAFDPEAHVERLERLNDAFWDKAWQELPPAWRQEEQFLCIRTYFTLVKGHAQEFFEQLKQHLS